MAMTSWRFEAIGTQWEIEIEQDVPAEKLAHVKNDVVRRIDDFDKTYSRFRPDSTVTAMSQAAGTFEFPSDASLMFQLYRNIYDISDGQVSPLIGQMMAQAGYDALYSLKPKPLTKLPAWDNAMSVQDNVITSKQPVYLDFGAAGKGRLVDLVSDLITDSGIRRFIVDAGGDMYRSTADGTSLADVGLEHPDQPGHVIGVVRLGRGALCGSAGNRRAWAGYNHILDPAKRASPMHIKAVWVTAQTTMLADMLTTALYFCQPDELKPYYRFEYAMVLSDNSLSYSSSFPATFF